jgi:hypothetical protein
MTESQYVEKYGEHPLAEYERRHGSIPGWRVSMLRARDEGPWIGPSETQEEAFKRLKLMLQARPEGLKRICVERVPRS